MLARKNVHELDKEISFQEVGHKYTITGLDSKITSVTTLVKKYFPVFDAEKIIEDMQTSPNWPYSRYYGMTSLEIQKLWADNAETSSRLGTRLHNELEAWFNQIGKLDTNKIEHVYFQNFWTNFQKEYPGFKPFRTEMLVFDRKQAVAGSIDLLLRNRHDQFIIIDWKRSKEIKTSNSFEKGFEPFNDMDHCNLNHYTLQLNFYKHILETVYSYSVVKMFIVVLHPDNSNYQIFKIASLDLSEIWSEL